MAVVCLYALQDSMVTTSMEPVSALHVLLLAHLATSAAPFAHLALLAFSY